MEQRAELKLIKNRYKKEKIKKSHRKKIKYHKNSIIITRTNIKSSAYKKSKDVYQITYFNYNKKNHFTKDYTELKAKI